MITINSILLSSLCTTERSEGCDEMARDEARHGKAFEGLLKRYFA